MKIDLRKVFIITILAICVIAINLAVYFKITEYSNKSKNNEEDIIIDTVELAENFNYIFDNKIDYQNNVIDVEKQDDKKELIYTSYSNKQSENINVNIPYLNINSDVAKEINNQINELFYKKAIETQAKINDKKIYNVKYKAYINNNILSLVISATLKEGDNAQRVIIKTYNYNLSSNSQLQIKQLLEYRKISEKYVQNKITETIKTASENANKYKELGYSKYLRDVNNDMYKLENCAVYFIGENKAIYIIYPYGNLNYTSEIDLLVI